VIDLPDDFPINCFLCPLDPVEAAAEIRARLSPAKLAALLRTLDPPPPPRTGGLHNLRIVREGKEDLVLAMGDREANTDNLRFLGRFIACTLESWQYCNERHDRRRQSNYVDQ
jgi:hypothetical protein